MARYTTIRVDPEVWECLVNRQALLTLKHRRRASMSDALKDVLREAAEAQRQEADAAPAQTEVDDDAR